MCKRWWINLFEGFITYGGMNIMEIEAINVGLQESMDFGMINQTPIFIEFLVNEYTKNGIHLLPIRYLLLLPKEVLVLIWMLSNFVNTFLNLNFLQQV